ncbi:prephenate dehydrogenase [Streptomyces sioyaensis]|uniref:Prephenate dehydrogenase n=1 Tax=Streptomyces sioyaensis TaxID=67364 RepID=A0A4Q1R6T0_9ACTN|nr:prephenate dehydrogenase [Streptomyces sioyaensis]MBM4792062.1 prephenate dehydrogenase [Streptomyces sioyaensis]RXS69012.1 prephenate dehydrogenase [Streptomyces sioyaensis]
MALPELRTAAVVGTGLIGTSVALALTARGVTTYLIDRDGAAARTAAALGAGTAGAPPAPVDLAVLAVPPGKVAEVLEEHQKDGLARAYTDVASVKGRPQAELAARGCDLTSFVGGHPMAGRERSGPRAGRADLFDGRPWVLTPHPATRSAVLRRGLELVRLCGAVPVVLAPDAHDRAVALVSHVPHLLATLMAARLCDGEDFAVRLAGQGLRDVTRIAAGDAGLWTDILVTNAEAVAEVLGELAEDLDAVLRALRTLAATPAGPARSGPAAELTGLLRRGNTGHARIPGKHGGTALPYSSVRVVLRDRANELARLLADASLTGANIEDIRLEHATNKDAGLAELLVAGESAGRLAADLTRREWTVHV